LFIIHGKEDKINDPASSKTFIDLIPIEDKKLSIVDVARHSVFIETEEIYQSVLKDTLEWLEKH
jgi:alpha-beta hydrolase superfamily lysophospholipase